MMGPLSMLALIVVLFGSDLVESLSWLANRWLGRLALVTTSIGMLLGAGAVGQRVLEVSRFGDGLVVVSEESLPERYPRIDREAPPFLLTDQFGEEVSLQSFVGRPVVLTFAYAHCQTICPLIVERALRSIEEARDAQPVLLVITLDPWRDTPSALPRIVASWNLSGRDDSHLLSGDPDRVVRVLEAFEVPFDRDEGTGEVTHPALLYLIDETGKMAYALNNPSVEWITTALARMDGTEMKDLSPVDPVLRLRQGAETDRQAPLEEGS
ncbi:MAG: SCO family protein [Thermoanaerobaculia bacterium]|nr:SCO family protein [Thermoanaerobaculia bacterium]